MATEQYKVLKPITDDTGCNCNAGEIAMLHSKQAFYLTLSGKVKKLSAKKKTKKNRSDQSDQSDPTDTNNGGK